MLHLAAVLAPNQDLAYMAAIVWTAINLLFSGFFVSVSDMPFRWMAFLEYITAFYFALEGLMTIEFQNRTLACSEGVLPRGVGPMIPQLLPSVLARPQARAGLNMLLTPTQDCIADTNALLNYFGYSRPFGVTVGILSGWWIALHLLTFWAMTFVAKRERR